MKPTMFEDDYHSIEKDLAAVEFVVSVIKDYIDRELSVDCRKVLTAAKDYFEGSIQGLKTDLKFFTPVPRKEI